MAIKGVIFDLGHTLMHLRGTWPEVFERGVQDLSAFMTAHRPDLDAAAFCQAWMERRRAGFGQATATMREVTAVESMRWTLAQAGVREPDRTLVSGAIDAFFQYEVSCWHLDPDADSVLRALSTRGLRLGMFSNATHDPLIQYVVDRLGLRHWLSPALSSAGTGIRKPDPAAFALFPAAWDLPPESIAVVGDTLDQDIVGAQQAGMRSVWYRSRAYARQEGGGYGDSGEPERVGPEATIEKLGDLPDIIQRL